jgi:hypothetical protein
MDRCPTKRSGEGERGKKRGDGPSGLAELLASVKKRRWWRGCRVDAAATMDFPSPTTPPLDRSRKGGGTVTVAVNLVLCAPGPHLLFIELRDRGPPTRSQLSVPDQDAVKGSDLIVGSSQVRSILTIIALTIEAFNADECGE